MGGIDMKQFNLEEYLANPSRKIVTKEGKPARIICTDVKGASYSVLALVDKGDYEAPALYTKKGEYSLGTEGSYDLFFAPEKYEGWINVYMNCIEHHVGSLYSSKEDALKVAKDNDNYVATVKIEWEE